MPRALGRLVLRPLVLRRLVLRPLALLALVSGCSPTTPAVDAGLDAATDAPLPPAWPHDLPPAGELGDLRGLTHARVIVHVHSPLSHDACDGEGWVDGALADADCYAHFRAAACTLRMDALMITDHSPHVDEVAFEDALWATEAGDEVVRNALGDAIAARWACPDGHRVLVTVGSENDLMPVALERHPVDPGDPVALAAAYDADGAAAAAVFRDAGGLVFYAHTESKTLDQIRGTDPDGIEIYNTHANIDPDIREELLGLPALGFIGALTAFTQPANRMEPDLAFLSFYSENTPSLATWDTLLAEGMHLTGTGGCDAHENSFAMRMPDGERGDSYRRMMRWHTHHVLVPGTSRDEIVDAIDRGRLYLAFEALGTPVGFDFHAEDGGTIAEMGDTTSVGATLRLVRPSLPAGFPSDPAPSLRMRILRAAAGGAVEVAAGAGETLDFTTTQVGVYRAEVLMVPDHARPYLGRMADDLVHERVWIYTNPIYVE